MGFHCFEGCVCFRYRGTDGLIFRWQWRPRELPECCDCATRMNCIQNKAKFSLNRSCRLLQNVESIPCINIVYVTDKYSKVK